FYFDNLLPDSTEIRKRVQSRFGTASLSTFELLGEIGRDCVGAVQLLPVDIIPGDIYKIESNPVTDLDIEKILRDVVSPHFFNYDLSSFRISVAGAQEKTAFLWQNGWSVPVKTTPTTHIFKLPLGKIGTSGIDLSTSVENEWLCSRIMQGFGVETAETEIGKFGKQKVLIVKRFDRKQAASGDWLIRLPQEDMCQATGTPGGQKYEADGGPGIRNIMDLLLGSSQSKKDRITFFKVQVLFWMLGAIDGHAKNFSIFLEPGGRFRLTPLYDIMSVYPSMGKGQDKIPKEKVKMAMAVYGKNRHYKWNDITTSHWIRTAKLCGLDEPTAEDIISGLVKNTSKVITNISSLLPGVFPNSVSDSILSGLDSASKQLGKG
ncbi:MAG: type II toxin-antitoxin system HipA family toxin, partial [Spirochaetota bacterium]|nr:type II toxin-antitoxin system HipA family toxin [Spirochaetota bacterium]